MGSVLAAHPDAPTPQAQRAMEEEGIKVSLTNLRSFPWVQAKESTGELKLVGAFFAISDGILHVLDEKADTFAPA